MSALPISTLAGVLLDRGRLAEAARAWRRIGLDGEVPDLRPLVELLVVCARLRHATGDTTGALEDVAEAERRLSAFGPASMNDQPPRRHRALLEHATGAAEEAAATATQALAVAESWGSPGAIGEALRVQGVVSGDADVLRIAVDRLAASPLRVAHAAALLDLGGLLRRSASRKEVRPGAAARGARPRAGLRRHIARLAAGGASNKEIAQALFLSVKTIEMHLGHAYRKLDIGSRRELAGALAAEPGAS